MHLTDDDGSSIREVSVEFVLNCSVSSIGMEELH